MHELIVSILLVIKNWGMPLYFIVMLYLIGAVNSVESYALGFSVTIYFVAHLETSG